MFALTIWTKPSFTGHRAVKASAPNTRGISLATLLLAGIFALGLLHSPTAQAQQWRTHALSELDRSYMDNQRRELDGVARQYLGRQFNGEKNNDLELLQLLLDRQLVRADQTELLQAMGFVLGEFLKREKRLQWVAYEDRKGRSRALKIGEHREFLFPTTMIARRVEAGAPVNVQEIYDNAVQNVDRVQRQIIVR